jgi:TatD DNase family protein
MQFTDTHTHLYSKEFEQDIEEVIQKAIANEISRLFLPNIDSSTLLPMLNLCAAYKGICFPMTGLHPCSVSSNYKAELLRIEDSILKENFVAIGEIGIDLYWDKTFEKEQKLAFYSQIELAIKHELPIVIHTRNSFTETIKIVEELNSPDLKGIFHCFSGDLSEAERILQLGGFKLGIGGVVTFKKSSLPNVLKNIPFSYIIEIAEKLTEIYDVSLEEIARITTSNSIEIFGI